MDRSRPATAQTGAAKAVTATPTEPSFAGQIVGRVRSQSIPLLAIGIPAVGPVRSVGYVRGSAIRTKASRRRRQPCLGEWSYGQGAGWQSFTRERCIRCADRWAG